MRIWLITVATGIFRDRCLLIQSNRSLLCAHSRSFGFSFPKKSQGKKLLTNELSASNANNNQPEQWFVINVSEHRPSNEPLHEINRTICHLNNEFVAHGEKFQYLQFGRCAKQKKKHHVNLLVLAHCVDSMVLVCYSVLIVKIAPNSHLQQNAQTLTIPLIPMNSTNKNGLWKYVRSYKLPTNETLSAENQGGICCFFSSSLLCKNNRKKSRSE